jgi:hypothetical protein
VLRACLAATDLAGKDSGTLEQERREVELQNLELKRHMSEVVASNGVDKQEAIEELRLEYEEHLREAVEETRQLMEREVKRQKLELEVYTQTLLELRNNLTKEADKNASLVAKTEHLEKCLRENEVSTSDTEKKKVRFEGEEQAAEQERELARRVEEARLQAGQEVEQEWEARVVQARAVWEAGRGQRWRRPSPAPGSTGSAACRRRRRQWEWIMWTGREEAKAARHQTLPGRVCAPRGRVPLHARDAEGPDGGGLQRQGAAGGRL